MHVILMGPQGSGKGTQSERVRTPAESRVNRHRRTVSRAIKGRTDLGQKIQAIYDRGELVPDDVTVALVEERLDQLAQERSHGARIEGALYDGFPARSLRQTH